ncbi:glycosyl transferase [Clostridium acetobutylicum]|nr:glycosyl transferase [Clostridium acetobutylicum]
MKHIFIVGSKGIPAKYGGFETFVDKLTERNINANVQYYVSCLAENNDEFTYNNAKCFNIKVPNIGSASAVIYDIISLIRVKKYISQNSIGNDSIVYILACRVGPFLNFYKRKIKELGAKVYVNPDGHEWKRSKWNRIIKMYWKVSERLMIKNSDLIICDSVGIEKYINNEYKEYTPNTKFIPYGAEIITYNKDDSKEIQLSKWMRKNKIVNNNYYLIVGRFVPENNYEIIIREFMNSKTKRDLVIVTNHDSNLKFYNSLKESVNFIKDKRIKFVGTVYDKYKLQRIRTQAFAYIHGHSVGGTNPSLLEALATTKLNLLYDVVFNREVGQDAAYYFSANRGNLSGLIDRVEQTTTDDINNRGELCKDIIVKKYNWDIITKQYEEVFSDICIAKRE